jgi:hypothetical protein
MERSNQLHAGALEEILVLLRYIARRHALKNIRGDPDIL